MRIDREAGLDVCCRQVSIGEGRSSGSAVLVPGEIAEGAGSLPVNLVDDLLDVAANQRLEQLGKARIEPDLIQ